MSFFVWVACILISYFVGYHSGRQLLRIKMRNALNYQRTQAHYTGDDKLTNIIDNLISRVNDA
jgi:hypothetical protein